MAAQAPTTTKIVRPNIQRGKREVPIQIIKPKKAPTPVNMGLLNLVAHEKKPAIAPITKRPKR